MIVVLGVPKVPGRNWAASVCEQLVMVVLGRSYVRCAPCRVKVSNAFAKLVHGLHAVIRPAVNAQGDCCRCWCQCAREQSVPHSHTCSTAGERQWEDVDIAPGAVVLTQRIELHFYSLFCTQCHVRDCNLSVCQQRFQGCGNCAAMIAILQSAST
jgi:hypothetical protein